MTTTSPALNPGEHVWVETIAEWRGPGNNRQMRLRIVGADGTPSPSIGDTVHDDRVHWRRMPDDTAAEAVLAQIRCCLMSDPQPCDHEESNDCLEAIAFLAATDQVGGAWRPAKPGETPGQVEPDDAPAAEPTAAGVPVGTLTAEPGPGAYLIGDLLAVRWQGDIGAAHWCVQASGMIDGYGNRSWDNIRRDYADKPMRRLLPHPDAAARPADTPTLAAIRDVVREVLDEDSETAIRLRVGLNERTIVIDDADPVATALLVIDNQRANLETAGIIKARLAREADAARLERDEASANLTAENARLRQQRDAESRRANQAEAAIRDGEALARELAEARHRVHDANEEIASLSNQLSTRIDERDEARRERDEALAVVGGQNLALLAERGELRASLTRLAEDWDRRAADAITAPAKHIWTAAANYLLATIAQEPAQTPGGGDDA